MINTSDRLKLKDSEMRINKGKTQIKYTIEIFQTVDSIKDNTAMPLLTEKALWKLLKMLNAPNADTQITMDADKVIVYKDGVKQV